MHKLQLIALIGDPTYTYAYFYIMDKSLNFVHNDILYSVTVVPIGDLDVYLDVFK